MRCKKENLGNYSLVSPRVDLWECDGANNSGDHFQTHEGQECDQESATWIYQDEIVLNQPGMADLVDEGRAVVVVYLTIVRLSTLSPVTSSQTN